MIQLLRTDLVTKAGEIVEARDRITTLELLCSDHGNLISSLSHDVATASKDLKCATRVHDKLAKELRDWTERNVLLQGELEAMERAVEIAKEGTGKVTQR